jgi:hypothetical protein
MNGATLLFKEVTNYLVFSDGWVSKVMVFRLSVAGQNHYADTEFTEFFSIFLHVLCAVVGQMFKVEMTTTILHGDRSIVGNCGPSFPLERQSRGIVCGFCPTTPKLWVRRAKSVPPPSGFTKNRTVTLHEIP